MPTTIDQKVVEMKFDNQQFESGISQSLSSLDKLKAALKFDNLGTSLTKIGADVATVSSSFTSMGIIAKRVLENIADIAFNTGASFVKSMSIGQVVAGWEKYAEITTSTQTIMAATKNDWKDQGEQMKYVNGQLEKLNWYTDETSYNLVDMTSNIGKFTSAGVKLDDATNAMMALPHGRPYLAQMFSRHREQCTISLRQWVWALLESRTGCLLRMPTWLLKSLKR